VNTNPSQDTSGVVVLGLGYVGCVSAACLAHLGNRVIGVDRDEHKVAAVNRGQAPFYEPGLEDLVAQGLSTGRLSATTSLAEALPQAGLVFICVGTPSDSNGNLDLSHVRRVCEEIARHRPTGKPLVLAVRSTVFPGTCDDVVRPIVGEDVPLVCHPEFLREGTAVRDFMEPSLIVIGGSDPAAVERVADVYQALNFEICRVSLRTAEMIKYTCNAFHALKIGFANEIGTLSRSSGVDPAEVMATVCRDEKLNISTAYLKPGFAFGGSCLPKDLRALVYRAGRMDLELPLLESILPSNREHLERCIQSALAFSGRIGIYGLAFKDNTDDIRESPVVTLIEQLIGKGREIRIFDPHIRLANVYGSNLTFVTKALPHIGRLMVDSAEELLAWAEYVVLAQKPQGSFAQHLQDSGRPALDLTTMRAATANQPQPVPSR
jgi:GDP-mannose 6-dehydrogenase